MPESVCRQVRPAERTRRVEEENTRYSVNSGESNTHIYSITEATTLGELLKILGSLPRKGRTPTVKKLWAEKGEPIAETERIQVFANGFAVYQNDSGRTVIWVPSCTSFTYRFNPLKDTEIGFGIEETNTLPAEYLEKQSWVLAIMLIGEHRIESNMMNRTGSRSGTKISDEGKESGNYSHDSLDEEFNNQRYALWRENQIGESPEDIYLRKEKLDEALHKMTEKQREAFIMYHKYGYNQREIASFLRISQNAVKCRLKAADEHFRKIFKFL